MQIQTQAIVLSYLKYGDSGLIVKCYTEKSGIESFILKNAFSGRNKKTAVVTILNQIYLIYEIRKNQNLIFPREITQAYHYKSLNTNPVKTTIVLFLGEILNSVLKEEESNLSLYNFISTCLIEFDSKDSSYADFHLWFLINLTRFLGFYPNLSDDYEYFDLANGVSTNDYHSGFLIGNEELELFKKIIRLNFFTQKAPEFNQSERKNLLEIIIRYFELHIGDFRRPKSLEVLYRVFE